jgi:BirA family transcriptional regulator, biotin operon repressor / biotin---[acetyl-CoA-carboxylase] ligase
LSGQPARLGLPRVHWRQTDSTNDRARELALAGAGHGTLVTADEQTAGRGRHGRRWWAPARSCLLMSLLLRFSPPEQGGRASGLLPLSAALAVCDVAGPHALVKWPNDVVVKRRKTELRGAKASEGGNGLAKLAGILIEGRPQQGWLVLGIGLNVALDLSELPVEVHRTAATLGRPPEAIEQTLEELLRALESRLGQTGERTLAAWRDRDALVGSQVSWNGGDGEAQGIDDRGRLLVRAPGGELIALDSGEVSLQRPA